MNSLDYLEFQKVIGYCFKNENLLKKALTHSSYIKDRDNRYERNNERLEFLGDAFFDAIISEELFVRLTKVPEGTLTKTRSKVVCEKSLAEQGSRLRIGDYMYMGNGEVHAGGRKRDSIIADAMEAIIGALFLDGGYESAKRFVLDTFSETLNMAVTGNLFTDYKTELQERLQALGEVDISYETTGAEGPDHDKTFFVDLLCNGTRLGHGKGKSKKEAEQNAAKQALERGGQFVL